MRLLPLVGLLALACTPAPDEGAIIVTVLAEQDVPAADAQGRAVVEIVMDEAARVFRRLVTVQITGGTFGDGDTYEARTPKDGVIRVPLRYGRRPGPVRIEITAGAYRTVDESLTLVPRLPDQILPGAVRPLVGDGIDSASLEVDLLVDQPGGRISEGVRVWFAACCDAPCTQPPIRVEPMAVVEITDAVRVQVTSRAYPADTEAATLAGSVAIALDGPPDCTSAAVHVPVLVTEALR
jgi:hypothetical protein